MMWRSFLCVAALLGLTAVASASGLNVYLTYATSYDADGTDVGQLVSSTSMVGGSTKTSITLDSTAVVHAFTVSVAVHDLAADQDADYFQFAGQVSGGVTMGDDGAGGNVAGGSYAASDTALATIDPVAMGLTTTSNATRAAQWNTNSVSGLGTFLWIVNKGATSTGNGNGTYGDYAATMAVGESSAYEMGTLYLSTDAMTSDTGTFSLGFTTAAQGYFGVLNQNGGTYGKGMGTSSTEGWLTGYTAVGDSIEFKAVPEPGTIALLLSGMIGLVAYAWRKRK